MKSGKGQKKPRSPSGSRFQGPPAAGGGHTLAHSRARCFVRLALRSSAYRAPMKEPMDVPPTRSTGTPASSNAFSTPMCEQPLPGRENPGTHWRCPTSPGAPLLPSPTSPPARNKCQPHPYRAAPGDKLHPSGALTPPLRASRGAGPTPHLAPPPPSTRAMVLPVSTRARREKSLCLSARLEKTFS